MFVPIAAHEPAAPRDRVAAVRAGTALQWSGGCIPASPQRAASRARRACGQPAERAQAAGYAHCLTAENIAFASSTRGFEAPDLARRLFDGWVQSPPHRRNLLDGDMTDVGIAVAQSARSGKHYAVQLFGRPRAMALRIELANRSRDTVQYELAGESYELKPGVVRTHERCRRALLALKAEGGDEASARPIAIAHGARCRIDDAPGSGIRLRRE